MTVADLIELLKQQPPQDHVGVESDRDANNYGTAVSVKREVGCRDRAVIEFREGTSHD